MPLWRDVDLKIGPPLRLVAGPDGVIAIDFFATRHVDGPPDTGDPLLDELTRQLRAYFEGRLRRFDLPLDLRGTDFQQRVWQALLEIPFGETRSYKQVADAIGAGHAIRAVGTANGANPIPIVVPCHRVIGSSGKLVGYGGGLDLKRRLLELEGAWTAELYV